MENIINYPHSHNISARKEIPNACKSQKSSLSLAYTIYDIQLNSQNNSLSDKLVRKNLWRSILNNLWYQRLFLSKQNRLTGRYYDQNYDPYLSSSKAQYKNIMSELSTILKKSMVCTCSNPNTSRQVDSASLQVEYMWPRSLYSNLINPARVYSERLRAYLLELSKRTNKNLSLDNIPLYVVSNNFGKMVVSEQPSYIKSNVLPNFYRVNTQYMDQAWFFVNFDDACEYMNSILDKSLVTKRQVALKIFTSNLGAFYSLAQKYRNQIVFRVIPDLNELSLLMTRYKYDRYLEFHPLQRYSKMSFQGQPVYIVKIYDDRNERQYASMTSNRNDKELIPIFMSYNDARFEEKRWKTSDKVLGFKNRSKIVVYNLEKFLENLEKTEEKEGLSYTIIPPRSSYLHLKNLENQQLSISPWWVDFTSGISSISLWFKRIAWSLTSKHPINL
uniref:Uncharacterized protein n=1 Tax=Neogoniolithon spectabile TaxID=231755 RepID=A0A3G3MGZ5_9FLOR|nr:hypothetical protein [Neogoniolithon spectabile]AYR06106.1 hypothetical protein [Neogoniolithon spectabile]